MLVHEFITVPRENVPQEITYKFKNMYTVVGVHDDVIFNNQNDFLKTFSCYWDYVGNSQIGLNYHGITIITSEHLPNVLDVLLKHKNQPGIKSLIDLCETASMRGWDVIHFGV